MTRRLPFLLAVAVASFVLLSAMHFAWWVLFQALAMVDVIGRPVSLRQWMRPVPAVWLAWFVWAEVRDYLRRRGPLVGHVEPTKPWPTRNTPTDLRSER